MSRKRSYFSAGLACAAVTSLVLTACSPAAQGYGELTPTASLPPVQQVSLTQAQAVPAITATNQLGLTLIAAAEPQANLVASPWSLAVALSMLAEGATPAGQSQLETGVLAVNGPQRSAVFNALHTHLAQFDADPATFDAQKPPEKPYLHVANNVVFHKGYAIKDEYLVKLHEWYSSTASQTDLSSPAGKKVLDAWVAHHTAGLVKKSAVQPSPDLRVVLQNAVLFGAKWKSAFSPQKTSNQQFFTPTGPVEVKMMYDSRPVAYAESAGWTAVRLPYQEGFYATYMLPPAGTDPAHPSPTIYQDLLTQLGNSKPIAAHLSVPKVNITSTAAGLRQTLENVGVKDIFRPGSLPDIGPDLAVSEIVQQAVLTIDEEGTVAAAVTELGAAYATPATLAKEFRVDRPFLFFVTETLTGLDLFAAVIRNPQPKPGS